MEASLKLKSVVPRLSWITRPEKRKFGHSNMSELNNGTGRKIRKFADYSKSNF